jgi:hypothetical protein
MKWLVIPIVLTLNGCAVYTVATATSTITTGKSLADHSATVATQNDCSSLKYVMGRQDYYCERAREPGTTYNRNAF